MCSQSFITLLVPPTDAVFTFEDSVTPVTEGDVNTTPSICVGLASGELGREVTFNINSHFDSNPMTADGELIFNRLGLARLSITLSQVGINLVGVH